MTPQLFYPVTLDSLKDKLTEDVELAFARWYHTPLTITPDDMRDMASWLELAFRAGAYWQRDMTDWKEAVEHGRIPETVQGQNRPTEQAPERQE